MWLASLAVLVASFTFLTINYPHMLRNWMPGWLATAQEQPSDSGEHQESAEQSEIKHETEEEQDSTPKVRPSHAAAEIPVFTLDHNEETNADQHDDSEPVAPSFPAANSAQRASGMLPPPKPASLQSSPGLMLPPSRPNAVPKPGAAASLRVPSSGPLPNRGPPASSQQRVTSSLSPNGTVKTPNPRGKVLLSPGHSPMDWAALTRKGNLTGVSSFQRVTPSQLKNMTGRKGKPAWSSWQGKVYNITPYLPYHPGGEAELMKAAGRDGAKLFNEVHPWVNWENMLGSCLVGAMVPEDYEKSSLEDMD